MTNGAVEVQVIEFDKDKIYEGYIDVSAMRSGDQLLVKKYVQMDAADGYTEDMIEIYDGITLADTTGGIKRNSTDTTRSLKKIHFTGYWSPYKSKITVAMIAGTNRTLRYRFGRY